MFTVVSAPAPPGGEAPRPDEAPESFVQRVSRDKAQAAASRLPPSAPMLVVAADTVVAIDGCILGKPADNDEAIEILKLLRGRVHTVWTAVTVLDVAAGRELIDIARTDVPMRSYDDDEIAAYVSTGDPLDKAGAYAIQHAGFHPVDGLSGCYANVMGLPLCHLTRTLRRAEADLPANVPSACQSHTGYHCPVYQGILEG